MEKNINYYEGLITVFAVMLAVEYSNDNYDIWDVYIGIISVYIGCYGYLKIAQKMKDKFYSVITSSLISLGFLNILSFLVFIFYPFDKNVCTENIRFLIFIILIIYFYNRIMSGKQKCFL